MYINLDNLITLIDSDINPFKEEILVQASGLVQVKESSLLESSRAYDVYESRFSVQKEITKHNLVLGWENLLPNLKTESSKPNSKTRLTDLIGEKHGYLIFSNHENDRLIGVLKFTEEHIIKDQELEGGRLKGSWTDSKFYLNKTEIKSS